MPRPSLVPTSAWELAETKEMEQVVGLYGKTYHLWQVDRGDVVPMGAPQLMGSFTGKEQIERFRDSVKDRDARYGVSTEAKAEGRQYIEEPDIHEGECGRRGRWLYRVALTGDRCGSDVERTERF